MIIHQIFSNNAFRNFSYLIEGKNGRAICIDPYDGKQVVDYAESKGISIFAMINTHSHGDHTCGNEYVLKHTACEYWAYEGSEAVDCEVNKFLIDGEYIDFDKYSKIKIIYTPGHIDGHICLVTYKDGLPYALISGDTVFNSGVGNCNSGSPEVLYETIANRIMQLPQNLWLYPGHDYVETNLKFVLSFWDNEFARKLLDDYSSLKDGEYLSTTLEMEHMINPFFNFNNPELVEILEKAENRKILDEKDVFVTLRKMRDNW